jgi:hypothetical protein
MEGANEGFPSVYICNARREERWLDEGCTLVFQA